VDGRVIRHDCVDSTNERALAAIAAGTARHGDIHVAREQTAGRGRRGHHWHSVRDEGIYLSLVLLPAPPALSPAALTIAGGLAAHATARALLGPHAGLTIKWPNDLLCGNKKLAGVLVETRGLDPASPHYVIGIGLNHSQRAFPAELGAMSLFSCGSTASRESVESLLCDNAAREAQAAMNHDPRLAARFLECLGLRGQAVRVFTSTQHHEGRLTGLDLDRGLSLEARLPIPLELITGVQRL
jgi:BirA family biotin operon repressor/biotin-[acetyl-CoA-carboxylase] ligase